MLNQGTYSIYVFEQFHGIDILRDAFGHLLGGVYMVHTGGWGGMLTRIITFLAALLGATLPLTGYYLWIRRLLKKSGQGHNHRA